KFLQVPPSSANPAVQPLLQRPAMHSPAAFGPVAQAFPQAPQCSGCVITSTHLPSQVVSVEKQPCPPLAPAPSLPVADAPPAPAGASPEHPNRAPIATTRRTGRPTGGDGTSFAPDREAARSGPGAQRRTLAYHAGRWPVPTGSFLLLRP